MLIVCRLVADHALACDNFCLPMAAKTMPRRVMICGYQRRRSAWVNQKDAIYFYTLHP